VVVFIAGSHQTIVRYSTPARVQYDGQAAYSLRAYVEVMSQGKFTQDVVQAGALLCESHLVRQIDLLQQTSHSHPTLMGEAQVSESEDKLRNWNDHLLYIGAAIIRDFLVVEDRKSLGGRAASPRLVGKRQIQPARGAAPTYVYLNRVRYTPSETRLTEMSESLNLRKRMAHMVGQHLRRLMPGAAASRQQIDLARHRGLEVPDGFTFVREHEAGTDPQTARIYRSRLATRVIFENLGSGISGQAEMSPAEFEGHCREWLVENGWTITYASPGAGDAGVDIGACVERGSGSESIIVQCKHYRTSVGPGAVRELAGALQLRQRRAKADRAILMVSTVASSQAIQEAHELGIEIIDCTQLFPVQRAA
jgi:hypothetical protein